MVTMNLGCTSESCFHFLHLTHVGTLTVDVTNGFLKTSAHQQEADELSIRIILPLEHTETFFNVVLKLRIAECSIQKHNMDVSK